MMHTPGWWTTHGCPTRQEAEILVELVARLAAILDEKLELRTISSDGLADLVRDARTALAKVQS